VIRTKEERIRSAKESVVRAAKRWVRADTETDGILVWRAEHAIHRAVAYLNRLEARK